MGEYLCEKQEPRSLLPNTKRDFSPLPQQDRTSVSGLGGHTQRPEHPTEHRRIKSKLKLGLRRAAAFLPDSAPRARAMGSFCTLAGHWE